jgi:ubiquinone/menaquinone biosynthesis C-methylase UbiE
VLDAACGTGQYFSLVAEAGLRVVGADQSAGMLDQARARGIALETLHVGLQELDFSGQFDAATTIDAMENVAPEDWPVVLANLRRADHPEAFVTRPVRSSRTGVWLSEAGSRLADRSPATVTRR